jgi:arylsulfatase A-like enzyme
MAGAQEFGGTQGRYHWDSEPWWPDPARAPDGSPNVLIFLLDDVGFAQLGCFGSDIETPTIDRLAAGGLRYTNFHTTALCSPTRSCVLTGRNHHSNGIGRIVELASGFPGYNGRIPDTNAMLPAQLTPEGYAAWAIGKWHLTPEEEEHLGATRTRWPLGQGFERFYGFFGGETHQFAPELVYDNHLVEPPGTYEDGYHLTEDLADRSIEFLRDLRAVDLDKPWFLYLCPGACHSPHQVPQAWLDKYRGRFDEGWDVWRDRTLARQTATGVLPPQTELSPRPDWVPAWDSLTDDERTVYARYMEAFAAMLSHTDAQLGRVVAELEARGELHNTLIFVLSDNGASSEGGLTGSLNDARVWNMVPRDVPEALERLDEIGGPRIHNNYPWGWTVAGNTPFRRWKREVHEGGVADPLIVHWPAGISDPGETRHQYVHAIDLAPTIYDATGINPSTHVAGVEQSPIHGTSFGYTFDEAEAPDRHVTQYYEMFGCRAIYHDGWKAVTYHEIQSDEPGLDQVPWELYDVRNDQSEVHDLATTHPEKLSELVDLWWAEADKYDVLPLDNRPFSDFVFERPTIVAPRSTYVYWPDQAPVPEGVAVNIRNRSHTVTAYIEVPDGGASEHADIAGVLIAQGSVLGGWTLYVADGQLVYAHNLSSRREWRIAGPVDLGPGRHELAFRFEPTSDYKGTGTVTVDGTDVGGGDIKWFTPHRFSLTGAGLTVGRDPGIAVSDGYESPFGFVGGTIDRVEVEVDGPPYIDPETEAGQALASQ